MNIVVVCYSMRGFGGYVKYITPLGIEKWIGSDRVNMINGDVVFFLSRIEQIRGMRNFKIKYYGSYGLRKDLEEIQELERIAGVC